MKTAITFRSLAIAAVALSSSALLPQSAQAAVSVQVIPSIAPNAFGSPNYAAYQANAVNAIENGLSTLGSGAARYDALTSGSNVDFRSVLATGFESWRGVAAPNMPTYSGEYGNRIHFGVRVLGNGTKFSAADVAFSASSTDSGNVLGFSFPAGVFTYNAGNVGIDYGPNLVKGGGDDTIITSGLNTQLVDEFIGRGPGNTLAVYTTDAGATLQDKIDGIAAANGLTGPFSFTGTVTVGAASGSATLNLVGVPEPTTLAVVAGVAVLGLRRRGK
jgi:hypothetical protein